MSITNAVFFSAATPGTAHFVSRDDWEANLFHGLLLQPQLHIIDGGIVAGPHLWDHIYNSERGGTSWLEEGLITGVIRPHLRRRSLEEVVEQLRDNRFANVGEQSAKIAKRLDGLGFEPLTWPTDWAVGKEYDSLVTSTLAGEVPAGIEILSSYEVGKPLLDFWKSEDLERWRTEWIKKARERAIANSEEGLRYSDIVCVAYETYSGRAAFPGVTVKDVLESIPADKRILATNLRIYFKILCELHGYNFARAIDCRPSLVNLDPLTAVVILSPSEHSPTVDDIEELGTVRLPSLNEFRHARGPVLTTLRDTDEGKSYFASLESWLGAPSEENRKRLAKNLIDYGDVVCRTLRVGSPILLPILTDAIENIVIGGGTTTLLTMAAGVSAQEAFAPNAIGHCAIGLFRVIRAVLEERKKTANVSVLVDRTYSPICRDMILKPSDVPV
ncbi:MAG: hypothetical protein JXA30_07140 [Deltaproteobacteria bacterium]|nr:hypothetical protein [Deltaproteobacteria bacterium]